MAPPGEVGNAVTVALQEGYRHIDCALIYKNEAEVGEGIKRSGVPREQIFITSKLWNAFHSDAAESLNRTLRDLGTNYLDLYVSLLGEMEDESRRIKQALSRLRPSPLSS